MTELADLIAGLSDPVAYPYPVSSVEVRQTHISAVFLAGDFVYKVKKPVDYGFLNFGTIEKRRYFCDEEVRLNRRLAPDVYLGVVPITRHGDQFRLEGEGKPIEWAVKMRRLPDEATLQSRLEHDDVSDEMMREVGRRIADFHTDAESGKHVDAFGLFDAVAGNVRENFEQSTGQIGSTVSDAVFSRIKSMTEEALEKHRLIIQSRAERGFTRDTHGDLRLEHVYLFPEATPPDNLIVIDCIEFAERYRFADPISDAAFLLMGLRLRANHDLAGEFLDAYIETTGDEEGRTLVPFYTAYRAVVRGKVEGMKLSRPEMSSADRAIATSKSRASWLLALDELETPCRRPYLLLIAGLPGTGKSTLARELAQRAGFEVIRSDVVRKDLSSNLPASGEGIYTDQWNQRTYAECLQRAEQMLFDGKRVIVDANFRVDADRVCFLEAAKSMGVRSGMLVCETASDIVQKRLSKRSGDASDADWSVYLRAVKSWEELSATSKASMLVIDTGASVDASLAAAMKCLQRRQVA